MFDSAIAHSDVDGIGKTTWRGKPIHPVGSQNQDVRARVVEYASGSPGPVVLVVSFGSPQSREECSLEHSPIHPTRASVRGDVRARLELGNAHLLTVLRLVLAGLRRGQN